MSNGKAPAYGWIIFAIFLCTVVNYVDRVNISIAAPEMIKEYGWSTGKLGIVFLLGLSHIAAADGMACR
jgi:sugar phosphate permease